uniref:Putative ribonuclease H-like domain-containing protein n=1 Tax=Tanacetum cinerariifolium TaxID=118510 RepID=A0A699GY07_TANCI|nr:putative ribonuclease H-like domain-containing protein [Tanacetum cinerariifolium]
MRTRRPYRVFMAHPKHRTGVSRQSYRIFHCKRIVDALVITYSSGKDKLQIFNLHAEAEDAYATVRKEAAHQNILGATNNEPLGIATGLIAEEVGFVTKGYRRNDGKKKWVTRDDKSHLKCEECGMSRYTKEQCFRIVGYPDWWTDGNKKCTKSSKTEKEKVPTTNTSSINKENTSVNGSTHMAQSSFKKPSGSWIFDCGATDTMTYEVSDFTEISKLWITHIQAANRERMDVKTGGTIEISPSIKLPNCLYVPSLSHKLLSISHMIKELNCSVLMHPTFCLLQDIRTRGIIRRGTEREGLYYVDEMTTSRTVMLAHGTSEREAWLWHRWLKHHSVKNKREKDKIGTKPDKNRKRGEARKSQKQLQSREQEKLKKMQVEGPKMQIPTKLLKKEERKGLELQFTQSTKRRAISAN